MTENAEQPFAHGQGAILRTYGLTISPPRWQQRLLFAGLLLFCLLYGAACAIFVPYVIAPVALPILVLAGLVIWALPGSRTPPVGTLERLFFIFLLVLVLWPNYLAITAPGLPWVTVLRLTGIPLMFVLLVCVSISGPFRAEVGAILEEVPALWRFLVAFIAIQVVSVAFSAHKGDSIGKLLIAEYSWTTVFFTGCYILAKPKRAERWAACMWLTTLPVCAIGLWQAKLHKLPWEGHIPSFLKVNDVAVARVMAGAIRTGTDLYRIQATFTNSLGLADYLAVAAPFAVHFMVRPYNLAVRILAGLTLPLIFVTIYLSHTRLGSVGLLIALLLYPLIWALRRWKSAPREVIPHFVMLAYPVVFAIGVAASFAVGKIRRILWGVGAETYSNQARLDQYHSGFPKVLSHPWGYGIGEGAVELGYVTPSGLLTIDTYYMRLALEYGVIGILVFYGILLSGIGYGIRSILRAPEDDEQLLLIPACIALVSCIVIQSVYGQDDNHPLMFMILALVAALVWRTRQAERGLAHNRAGAVIR